MATSFENRIFEERAKLRGSAENLLKRVRENSRGEQSRQIFEKFVGKKNPSDATSGKKVASRDQEMSLYGEAEAVLWESLHSLL